MNKLKELRLIVKMNERLGVETEQSVLDQIIAEEQKEQKQIALREERKNVFKSTFSDLSGQISKLMAEEKQKSAEEQALLDRFANVLSKIDEIKANTSSDEPQVTISEDADQGQQVEDVLEGIVDVPEVIEEAAAVLAPIEEPTLAKEAAKKIKKKDQPPSMFVQPAPEVTGRDLKDIQQKLKLLEGWVGKISMTGPGGGAVWLRDLDDVARSSVLGAADGQVLTYDASIKKWTAQDPTGGGLGGYTLPTASTTVKGGVKIDGTTITISNTVISANVPVTDITSIDGTVQITPNNGVHDLSVANTRIEKVYAYVTNDDSVTIHKGDPVYLYRATGNRASVIQARNTSDTYSAKTLGLAAQDIAPGNPGWIQTQGTLTGVDTSAYAEGDTLYLGSTPGTLTNVKPYAPNHLVYIGVVERANQGQGQIYIRPQNGYELEELHNVNIDHNVVLANGHVLVYNANNSLWENRDLSGLVAAFTSNNSLYLGGIAANQYISTTADWVLDEVGISFPNGAGIQTTPFVGDADLLGGIAADQYAYANAIPSIAGLQTTAGLSANVAKLSANNTLFLGGIAANQYAYANAVPSIAGLQTTAGLSANVLTLTANNTNFLGTKAANQYAYANGSNFSLNNSISITYAGATPTGYALTLAASNTQGGAGYADFLKVTNTTAGATANSKSFRLTNGGGIEIVNSGYTSTILGLSDTGDFSVAGKIQVNGKTAVNGPAFSAYAAAILQTIPSDTQTKVLFQTEEFDTANCYASSRFTPNVEGYYQLNAEVRLDGTSGTGEMMIILYKNGTEYKRGTNQSGTQIAANFWAMQVSSVVYANGSSDYFEIYVQQGSGAGRTVTAVNNSALTWFNGCMLRGA